MINTLLADAEPQSLEILANSLNAFCPQLNIRGLARSKEDVFRLIEDLHPELIFIETEMTANSGACIFEQAAGRFEIIMLHSNASFCLKAPRFQISGHLVKPVQAKELVTVVQQTQHWIQLKREQSECRKLLLQLLHQSPGNNLIGIPTQDGLEFLKTDDILRCEGLHGCTKVVKVDKTCLISSYNIGEFCKLLSAYGFFSSHKSHLINLQHIRKYMPEGTIIMKDGTCVPVSRRRKSFFLQRVCRL